jgi:hypothetical protein
VNSSFVQCFHAIYATSPLVETTVSVIKLTCDIKVLVFK